MMTTLSKQVMLSDLFSGFPFGYIPETLPLIEISMVTADSRRVEKGGMFVACRGEISDGHRFIGAAIGNGARAVVGELPLSGLTVPYFRVENARQALAYLAAGFYDHPARKMTMIGVTGTDGKTTTTNLLYSILNHAGMAVGMVSTVNAVIRDETLDTGFHVTTPDAPDVQGYLEKMVEKGVTHAILETTSHGWAQHRVDACEFDLGIITNITHEHLDHHGTFENYQKAKGRLFESLGKNKPKENPIQARAILNKEDNSYRYLEAITQVPILSYGIDEVSAEFRAKNIRGTSAGNEFDVYRAGVKEARVNCPLPGGFNVYNCLAAYAATVGGLGIDPEQAEAGLALIKGVAGRMEAIDLGQEFSAYVDFAHTPNALKQALLSARQFTKGRVIVVFGSAGLRDREKRSEMAKVAIQYADMAIFTAEDPRTESLAGILDEMVRGADSVNGVGEKNYLCIPDRGEAIRQGILLARNGDLVMACGKGHEQSMCFGETEYAWDDRVVLTAVICEMLGIEGPEIPYLPTQDAGYE